MQRDGADERHTKAVGQALAAARTEQRVGSAVFTGEVAHVLDHPCHAQVAPTCHVGRPGGNLLRRHRGGRHDEELGAGQQSGQAHLDVARARRQVDQQVVEIAPVGVLEELLHGTVEHEAAPHDRLFLVGEEPHGQDAHESGADRLLERHHLPLARLDVTLHAQQSGDGEAPDVGVEDPDGEARAGPAPRPG